MTANQKFAQIILVSETTDQAGYSKNETHIETYLKKASEGFPGNVFQFFLQPGPAPHLTGGDLQRSDHPTHHHFFHSPEVTLLSLLLLKFLGKKGETPQQPFLHGPRCCGRLRIWALAPAMPPNGADGRGCPLSPPGRPIELRTRGRWASLSPLRSGCLQARWSPVRRHPDGSHECRRHPEWGPPVPDQPPTLPNPTSPSPDLGSLKSKDVTRQKVGF